MPLFTLVATHHLRHRAVEEGAEVVWLPFEREKEKVRGTQKGREGGAGKRLKAAGVESWRKEKRQRAG